MTVDWATRAREVRPSAQNFIAGRRQPGASHEALDKYSPRDGQLLCRFSSSTEADVVQAVIEARRAFDDGRWSMLPQHRRKSVLLKLAALVEEHAEELALLESLDVGKPIRDSVGFDIPYAVEYLRFNAEAADKDLGKVYAVDASSLSYQLRRPVGVVGAITGWNFPLVLAVQKLAPALATGNCVVLKPSELTPMSTVRLAELAIEAGVPEGVFNVILGGPNVGSALAHHDNVDLVTFTGSTGTGKKLLVAAGESNLKRLILECGGKAANIVFEDCPSLEAVADGIVARAFRSQGQVCTASSRLLLHESIKRQLLPMVIEKAALLCPGDPLLPETTFGPLVSEAHRRKVESYIGSGQQEGANLAFQGQSSLPFPGGFYVPPVIFDNVSPKQRIAREEIFGPVLSVMTFRTDEEAIRLANDTIYGLSAILWTKNLSRAHRITHAINAGWIVVNGVEHPVGGPSAGVVSIGGHKQSGIGAEGGIEGLEEYTSRTAVQYFV